MIRQKVREYIQKERLLSLQDKVLVALSGGADSVALLRLLVSAGYACEAAHCNFHLRGEESNRDEQFVRQICKKYAVPLHVIHFDTIGYATGKHISIEMAARELRYAWFAEIKKECGATVIAVAHHQDDSIETILLNLIRGTGIHGLLGIRPRNGDIVRPLLCVNREEIIRYLDRISQDYMTDSTNLEDEYTRNKIRLRLVPLMEEINPSVKDSLAETSNHLAEVARLYDYGIKEGKSRVVDEKGIHIPKLLREAAPQALLFEILHPLGFNSVQIENIFTLLQGQSGKQVSSKEWRVIKDRKYLLLGKIENVKEETPPFRLIYTEHAYTPDFTIPKEKEIACFDADKFKGKISLRKWETGDTFIPFGMKGKKKISDYLINRKFTLHQKEQQWVLCCNDQIAWLVGERTDNRFRIDENTQKIVKIEME